MRVLRRSHFFFKALKQSTALGSCPQQRRRQQFGRSSSDGCNCWENRLPLPDPPSSFQSRCYHRAGAIRNVLSSSEHFLRLNAAACPRTTIPRPKLARKKSFHTQMYLQNKCYRLILLQVVFKEVIMGLVYLLCDCVLIFLGDL